MPSPRAGLMQTIGIRPASTRRTVDQAREPSTALPLRDEILWDSERVGEERVELLRDLDVGEMAPHP